GAEQMIKVVGDLGVRQCATGVGLTTFTGIADDGDPAGQRLVVRAVGVLPQPGAHPEADDPDRQLTGLGGRTALWHGQLSPDGGGWDYSPAAVRCRRRSVDSRAKSDHSNSCSDGSGATPSARSRMISATRVK